MGWHTSPAVARAEFPADKQRLRHRGLFRLMERWWGRDERARRILLVLPARADFCFFEEEVQCRAVPEDTLRRIGYFAGIWKALQIVYSTLGLADDWVKRPTRSIGMTDAARAHGGRRRDRICRRLVL